MAGPLLTLRQQSLQCEGMTESFTNQMRRLVREAGIKQCDLHRSIVLDKATISRFLSGERFLSEDALNKLAKFLKWKINNGRNS
ncbi:MAG TPA: helix-turn-helix transcriptional regulator [Pirellulales bacterium]|jgi:ribosome-binding protein aMBF1 (putative translation factor)|nr:helix-turn-helix transcriptional regulator [Pirellulales bacterium]